MKYSSNNSLEHIFGLINDKLKYKQDEMNEFTIVDILNMWEGMEDEEVIYSLEERVVGKWIDGKPLYEKCIVTPEIPDTNAIPIASNTVAWRHNIDNVDTILPVDGFALSSVKSDDVNDANVSLESFIAVLSANTAYF